jgi:hypothetical protein
MHFLSVCREKNSAHFHKNVNPPMGVSHFKRLDHEINMNHLTINIFSTCLPLKVRNKTENPFISPLRIPIAVILSLKMHTESCLDPEKHGNLFFIFVHFHCIRRGGTDRGHPSTYCTSGNLKDGFSI